VGHRIGATNKGEHEGSEVADLTEQLRSNRTPAEFHLHRRSTDHRRSQLVAERQILELISLGAPLPGILNKLCMMIDVRIGNVVSIVSLPHEAENHICSMTHNALQVGLDIFFSSAILSPDNTFLGMLEIFGCDARRPTMLEYHLIDRVSYLAALALQRPETPEAHVVPKVNDYFERLATKPKGKLIVPSKKPPYII
jgi:hypothetical protein